MMMMVDLSAAAGALEDVKKELDALGGSMRVSISMMHEQVFSAMHRI
jgi:ACT domain-containing protein